jgi:hypothetical protein
MMYFSDRYDHAIPLFLDLRILPVTFLYCETVSGLMYDINNNNAPLNILNLFDKSSSIHSHNTRLCMSEKFYLKSSGLEIQKQSFSRFGVKLWNGIPYHITILSKKLFKKFRQLLFDILEKEDDYIQIPTIIKKIGLTI